MTFETIQTQTTATSVGDVEVDPTQTTDHTTQLIPSRNIAVTPAFSVVSKSRRNVEPSLECRGGGLVR